MRALSAFVCGFTVIALALSTTAAASSVAGRLVLGAYKPADQTAPSGSYNWELQNGFKQVLPDSVEAARELAVVLVGSGEGAAADVEARYYGGALLPSTLVVRSGGTLVLRNDDEVAHEPFAEGLDKLSAEVVAPRGRRSANLPDAGSWPLRDHLVVHARGHLHVLPDLVAVASLASDGRFTFADVAPGEYTLKVFHGEHEIHAQPVTIETKALTIDPIALAAKAAPSEQAQ